jgi:hypothetical protein
MPTISHRRGTSRTVTIYHCTRTVAGILIVGPGGHELTLRKSGTERGSWLACAVMAYNAVMA